MSAASTTGPRSAATPARRYALPASTDGRRQPRHRLAEWAGGEKRLEGVRLRDHNSILWNNFDEYMSEIATFLARVPTGRPA